MFHLHLHDPSDDLPADQVEIADCCRGIPGHERMMATITADEIPAKSKPVWRGTSLTGWDWSASKDQNYRLLRKLVNDANECEQVRRTAIATVMSIREENTKLRDLVLRMAGKDMLDKLTSEKVLTGLERDIAGLPTLNPAIVEAVEAAPCENELPPVVTGYLPDAVRDRLG